MNSESSTAQTFKHERLLSPAAVAGRFLTRLSNVQLWIAEGRLATVETRNGPRVPESAVLRFQAEAYRREKYNGIDHGLHSWPDQQAQRSSLPVAVQDADLGLENAPRWPFPRA